MMFSTQTSTILEFDMSFSCVPSSRQTWQQNIVCRKAAVVQLAFFGRTNSSPPQSRSQVVVDCCVQWFVFFWCDWAVTKNSSLIISSCLFVWIPFLLFKPIPWLVINQLLSHAPRNAIWRDTCPTLRLSTITKSSHVFIFHRKIRRL
jgi:hypothetical protein